MISWCAICSCRSSLSRTRCWNLHKAPDIFTHYRLNTFQLRVLCDDKMVGDRLFFKTMCMEMFWRYRTDLFTMCTISLHIFGKLRVLNLNNSCLPIPQSVSGEVSISSEPCRTPSWNIYSLTLGKESMPTALTCVGIAPCQAAAAYTATLWALGESKLSHIGQEQGEISIYLPRVVRSFMKTFSIKHDCKSNIMCLATKYNGIASLYK